MGNINKQKDRQYIKDKKRLMRLNVFLANWWVIAIMCSLLTIFFILIGNYAIVSVLKLMNNKFINAENSLQLSNCFDFSNLSKYKWIYIILGVFIAIWNCKFIYDVRTSYKDLNVNQKGGQSFETLDNIKKQYKEIPLKVYEFEGRGGMPVCRLEKKWYIDDAVTNSLKIGITRSGKGECFVFPEIDIYSRAKEKASMVINDPKLELYASSRDKLIERGYDVYVLNLDEPLKSMGYNPLQLIIDAYKNRDYASAEMLCNTLAYSIYNPDASSGDNKFFQSNSCNCLSALILAHIDDCINEDNRINAKNLIDFKRKRKNYHLLDDDARLEVIKSRNAFNLHQQKKSNEEIALICSCEIEDVEHLIDNWQTYNQMYVLDDDKFITTHDNEKRITMYSIINTFSELAKVKINDFTTALDIYFNERPALDRAKLKYSAVEVSGGRTKGSVFSNTLTDLTIFTYENFAKMTATNSLNLVDIGFGDKPVAVFMSAPDYDSSAHFLASLFVRQVYFILAKTSTKTKGNKCKRQVVFILDEFGNMPKIENMANIITVCLGRNICFSLYIQSYAQIEELYGKGCANTIITNCGNQVYILADDEDTANRFSKLIGSETIINVQRSGAKMSLKKHYMEHYEDKPLLNTNELLNFKEGENVICRAMKRKDLKGNDISSMPIFNSVDTRTNFVYRHKYMLDDFPNISPCEAHYDYIDIELEDYVLDISKWFEKKTAEKEGMIDTAFYEVDMLVRDLEKSKEIFDFLDENRIRYNANTLNVWQLISKLYELLDLKKIDSQQIDSVVDLVA